jgi:hypothetical protein
MSSETAGAGGVSGGGPGSPGTPLLRWSVVGTTVVQAPLTWMLETDPRRGQVWVCESCARRHLRAIESKLDQAWW